MLRTIPIALEHRKESRENYSACRVISAANTFSYVLLFCLFGTLPSSLKNTLLKKAVETSISRLVLLFCTQSQVKVVLMSGSYSTLPISLECVISQTTMGESVPLILVATCLFTSVCRCACLWAGRPNIAHVRIAWFLLAGKKCVVVLFPWSPVTIAEQNDGG